VAFSQYHFHKAKVLGYFKDVFGELHDVYNKDIIEQEKLDLAKKGKKNKLEDQKEDLRK